MDGGMPLEPRCHHRQPARAACPGGGQVRAHGRRFTCRIEVTRDDQTVAGTSILGLMLLGAGAGTVLTLRAEGDDAGRGIGGARRPDPARLRRVDAV